MKKIQIILIIMIFSFTVFILGGCSKENVIMATGTIQGKEVILTSKITSECQKIFVEEGDKVAKGQTLIKLDDTVYKLRKKQAESGLKIANIQLEEAINGNREEEIKGAEAIVEQLQAKIDGLKVKLNNLKNNYERYMKLSKIGAIPNKEIEDLETEVSFLENQIKSLEKQKEAQELKLLLLKKGPRQETIEKLRAQVEGAQSELELAEYNLSQTEIKSPIDGIINSLSIEEGENVLTGSTVTSILNPKELWVKVYLPEKVMGKIFIGQKVAIKIDTFPNKDYSGEVIYISNKAQFTPRNVQTKDERTTTVFPVKVKILDGFGELKIGLPADVYFDNTNKGELQ